MDFNLIAEQVAFYSCAGLALLGALGVAFSRQVLHACLWLLPCLFGVGLCYGILGGHLLFAVQLLVYVGAITVLILFAVMLLQRALGGGMLAGQQHLFGAVVATGIFMLTAAAAVVTSFGRWASFPTPVTDPGISGRNVQLIGKLFLTTYLLPFEAVSIVLLVAMVGAIILARRDKPQAEEAGETLAETAGAAPTPEEGETE